jgi:hypothetical protein
VEKYRKFDGEPSEDDSAVTIIESSLLKELIVKMRVGRDWLGIMINE